ncbi:uncharacterized protein LOC129728454 [Wyeomyia smithii]|uniref:uncharacterized protein LOC129728454 n=1 Tax=Wyeomyia smithii TaxID=174621 RepID=UPI002467EB3B|nr:uncharacterized protein LOC129728454 [Wyeomyia smithii]
MANKEASLINGFRKCGLCPFDANALDYELFPKPFDRPSSLTENVPSADDCQAPEMDRNLHFMQMMNKKLTPEKLSLFREQRNNLIWSGPVEDTTMFYFWRNTMDEIEGLPEFIIIDAPFVMIEGDHASFADDSANSLNNEATNTTEDSSFINVPGPDVSDFSNNLSHDSEKPEAEAELCEPYQETTRVETEPNHLGNISNTHMGVVGNRQKKTKRKFPAVATSEGWAEIYIQGEQEKMEKENAKKTTN